MRHSHRRCVLVPGVFWLSPLVVLVIGCGNDKSTNSGPADSSLLAGVWSVFETGQSCEITSELDPYWSFEKTWVDTLREGDLIFTPDVFSKADFALDMPVTEVQFILCLGVNTPERVDMLCLGYAETPNCRGPISVRYIGAPESHSWLLQKRIDFTYGGPRCGLLDSARVCYTTRTVYTRVGEPPP